LEGKHRFRAIALTDNVPLMTAVSNDLSYADVFVEPLRNLLQPGDTVIAISASGNSPNIVKAVEYARISRSRTGLNMAYLFPAKETSNHAQAQLQA